MHIIVCIKQVPDTTDVKLDPVTGSMLRAGVESKINVYDLYALECAALLRERQGGRITALSMGPPQAKVALREALELGADAAVLVSDKAFAGADVLATSYALSQAIRTLGDFDLVLCGKQTTDGDTAQVGPALAEQLAIPHVSYAVGIDDITPQGIILRQDLGEEVLDVALPFPCLVTLEKGELVPRLPSYKRKQATRAAAIATLALADLPDPDPARYGANGSATQVERIFPPAVNLDKVMLTGDAEALADGILDVLVGRKFI